MRVRLSLLLTLLALAALFLASLPATAGGEERPLELTLRSRVKGEGDRYSVVEKKATWDPGRPP